MDREGVGEGVDRAGVTSVPCARSCAATEAITRCPVFIICTDATAIGSG